jgi:hypothetical protein
MDKPISNGLRTLFLIHAIVGLVFGVPLWFVPGRFLTLVGWVPAMVQLPESTLSIPGQTFVDAAVARLVGVALVALALSSIQGYRAKRWDQVELLVQLEAVFCVLGALSTAGTGLFFFERVFPLFGWIVTVLLAVFAVAWLLALRRGRIG